MNDLAHFHALVTRPDVAGTELCQQIESRNGTATYFPTLAFAAPQDTASFEKALETLGEMDWLIFISPVAVVKSVPAIRKRWPLFSPRTQIAAVGKGTAKSLLAAGYQVSAYPTDVPGSIGLLALPAFHQCQNKKIALIKGHGGNDYLEKTLQARGASVTLAECYQRTLPLLRIEAYAEKFKQFPINVIVITSGESLQNLKLLCDRSTWLQFLTVPLVVISDRIKNLASDLGFQTIWLARNASHAAIIDVLIHRS